MKKVNLLAILIVGFIFTLNGQNAIKKVMLEMYTTTM
jgi:hypothetical protein